MADDGPAQVSPLRRRFDAEPRAIRAALADARAWMAAARCPRDFAERTELALAEALNNVAEHAYAGRCGPVLLVLSKHRQGLLCALCDAGGPMPPSTLRPRVGSPEWQDPTDADHLPEGGYGWFLIQSLAIDLQYRRRRGVNGLRFRVPGTGAPGAG